MKALQITEPYKFRIIDMAPPVPTADEVVIKLEYAAICNQNDYKIFYGLYGDLIKYPCEPGVYGHEGVGIITEIGSNVSNFKVGDRVVMMLEGGPMLYREYVCRKAWSVVPVRTAAPEAAAVLEIFGCTHHCLEIAGDLGDKKVAIAGLGPAGLALLQLISLNPPRELIGIEISEERAEAGRRLGMKRVINPIVELGSLIEEGADLVIDATGVPQSILNSFEITRHEVIIFGFTNEKFEVDQSRWFQKELVIKNSKVQTIGNLRAVVQLLEEGRIDPGSFIGGIMSFEEYDKAVEKVYKKEAVKILLKW
ncbi:MAG: zinc-dependent alcohol dehydrogenase [bacterium]|jgi:threonine dehydrogenase-like Zn-dependent dehydrogenase|nr:alcohol dehydrogenase catalytic domain-containing protein [bacterium]MDD3804974.1 alcohol dehydrogenase catalytic domain-containing protein [bacterium]